MKWLKRILISLAVILVVGIGTLGLIGYFVGGGGGGPKGPSLTITTGGKKVIATAFKSVNQKAADNGVTVTLDDKHVVVVGDNSITVNGEQQPMNAKVINLRSYEDGRLTIEEASE
jgi:hypothetical protein